MNPKISIITVSYNSEATISKTIESVLSQSFTDFEYIIIDGQSKDRTLEVIQEYIAKYNTNNITVKLVSEKDSGIYDAINKGIYLSKGDIIGLINSDDYLANTYVLDIINETFKKYDIDCLHSNVKIIDKKSRKTVRLWSYHEFRTGDFMRSKSPAHPTFYCKKMCYEKLGGYKIDYKIAADVELMFRFLEINKIKSKYIDMVTVIMFNGGVSNRGVKSKLTIIREMRKAFRENGYKFNLLMYMFYKISKVKQYIKRV